MVFRFERKALDRVLSPFHMWGTREAIARLPDTTVIEDSAREVESESLEDGFFFETATPRTVDVRIESEPPVPWK
jgi:hypothetical protein